MQAETVTIKATAAAAAVGGLDEGTVAAVAGTGLDTGLDTTRIQHNNGGAGLGGVGVAPEGTHPTIRHTDPPLRARGPPPRLPQPTDDNKWPFAE